MVSHLQPIHMAIISCENVKCSHNIGGGCKKTRGHQTRTCGAYTLALNALPLTTDPRIAKSLRPRRIL